MPATLTTFANVLKEAYPEPLIQEQLNHKAVLLWHLERRSKPVGGRRQEVPIHTGRNVGIGARAESGTLPTAGSQAYEESIVNTRFNYARGQVTGPSIARSRGDAHAFARIIDQEMRGAIADCRQDVERQLFGDGSGTLTNVRSASTNATTVTVQTTKYLPVGLRVDVRTRSDGTLLGDSLTVDAVDATGRTISLSAAVTVTTTSGIYREDARNVEMMGIAGIVLDTNPATLNDTGVSTLQGLSTAAVATWVANVLANAGTVRDIGFDEIQEAFDETEIDGASYPELLVSSHVVRRKLVRDEIIDKRYAQEMTPLELEAGFDWYRFGQVPLVPAKDSGRWWVNDYGQLYGLTLEELGLYEDRPIGFLDYDGAILSRVANQDAWEFTLAYYAELATNKRNAHFVIVDIDTT